jgi:hypothetical protein
MAWENAVWRLREIRSRVRDTRSAQRDVFFIIISVRFIFYSFWRLFTTENIVARCNSILEYFHHNYRIATAFSFASEDIMPVVKGCVYLFFTTGKIKIRCKTYFIFLFTSSIYSTDVKSLLKNHICTSVYTLWFWGAFKQHSSLVLNHGSCITLILLPSLICHLHP